MDDFHLKIARTVYKNNVVTSLVIDALKLSLHTTIRAAARMLLGGLYSYIHVLPDEFLFKSNSNCTCSVFLCSIFSFVFG